MDADERREKWEQWLNHFESPEAKKLREEIEAKVQAICEDQDRWMAELRASAVSTLEPTGI